MANAKRMKTWRRSSLSYTRDDRARQDMAKEYKLWLCKARGWFTDTEVCKKCHGDGTVMPDHSHMTYSRQRTWKKNRVKAGKPTYLTEDDRVACYNCKGEGKVSLSNSVPDLRRAEDHISEQSARLDRLARDAVEEIEVRLRDADLRPVPDHGAKKITSLADFDAWEAERSRLRRAYETAWEVAAAAREAADAAYEAMTGEEKCAYINNDDRAERPHKTLERRAWEAQSAMHRHGDTARGYWWRPGDKKLIYVGTERPRRDRGANVVVIIKPGRSPSFAELDQIAADALAELDSIELDTELAVAA